MLEKTSLLNWGFHSDQQLLDFFAWLFLTKDEMVRSLSEMAETLYSHQVAVGPNNPNILYGHYFSVPKEALRNWAVNVPELAFDSALEKVTSLFQGLHAMKDIRDYSRHVDNNRKNTPAESPESVLYSLRFRDPISGYRRPPARLSLEAGSQNDSLVISPLQLGSNGVLSGENCGAFRMKGALGDPHVSEKYKASRMSADSIGSQMSATSCAPQVDANYGMSPQTTNSLPFASSSGSSHFDNSGYSFQVQQFEPQLPIGSFSQPKGLFSQENTSFSQPKTPLDLAQMASRAHESAAQTLSVLLGSNTRISSPNKLQHATDLNHEGSIASKTSSQTVSGAKPKKVAKKKARGGRPKKSAISCIHCGSRDTPEWRKGPDGFRTLCNACGLFYSKLTKRYGILDAAAVLGYRKKHSQEHDRAIPSTLELRSYLRRE